MGDSHTGTDQQSVQNHCDWRETTPSTAVIDAIAAIENVESVDLPLVLDTTLFDHIDPDALDTLVNDDEDVLISFSVDEYAVRIDGCELLISHNGQYRHREQ